MKQNIIRLNEAELKKIVTESVKRVIRNLNEGEVNEYAPETFAAKAQQAQQGMNSFGGKVRGFVNPKWKVKKQAQIDKINDYSQDTVGDKWTREWVGGNKDFNAYDFQNQRTGEVRRYDNWITNKRLPIRGQVVNNDGSYNDFFNNPKFYAKRDESIERIENLVSEAIKKVIKEDV